MIKQTKNGKWRLYMLDEYGEKVRIIFEKKADAVAKEAQIKQRKYDAKLAKAKLRKTRYSFDRALKDFENTKSELRENTKKRYKSIMVQFGYFIDALGLKYVDEFTSDHGTMFYNELVKEKIDPKGSTDRLLKPKPKTVNMFLQVVKGFFREEWIKGHIQHNPVIHLKNLKVDKKAPDFYTEKELQKFFSQSIPNPYRIAFIGLLHTGMRFAELANVRWQNIDFNRKLIHVRSTEQFRTKTVNSERAIPMTNDLYSILLEESKKQNSEFVFTSPQGTQLRERRTLEVCKKIAKDAGIKSNAYLHKFRHTYATILVRKGVPLQEIKELLGHSSVVETEIYAHNKSDYLHDRVSHLDNIIDSEEGQS